MSTSSTPAAPKPRQKPRYSAQLKVEVFTKGLEHVKIDQTANISETGVFLCTEVVAELNEKLHLRIIFADQEAYFDVKARVAWICDGKGSHPQGMGMQFTDVNGAQKTVIDKYLKAYVNVQK